MKKRDLWRTPHYIDWLLADTSFALVYAVRAFSLVIVVTLITGSTAQAGTVTTVSMVTSAVLLVPAGLVQDRYSRRRLAVWGGVSGVVLFGIIGGLVHLHLFTFPVALVAAVLLGARAAFTGMTTNLILRTIVAPKDFPAAMAVNQARDSVLNVIGAPVAGVLIRFAYALPFVVSSALSAMAALTSWRLPADDPVHEPGEAREKVTLPYFLAGARLILSSRYMSMTCVVGNIVMALYNGVLMAVVWQVLAVSRNPALASTVSAGEAAGTFLGALAVGWILKHLRGGYIMSLSYAVLTLAVCVLPFLGHHPLAMIAVFLFTMFLLPVGSAVGGSIIMLVVPQDALGRAFSFLGIVELVSGAASTVVMGLAFEHLGYVTAVGSYAAVMVVLTSMLLATRQIREIPFPEDYEEFVATLSR